MKLQPCIFVAASLFFGSSVQAFWEYAGFSGEKNEIKAYGLKELLHEGYPESWQGFGKGHEICLCDKKTEGDLFQAIKVAFGDKESSFKGEVSSGIKRIVPLKENSKRTAVEVYGLIFRNPLLVDTAFSAMKRHLSDSSYAIIKSGNGIYFLKKAPEVPARAFIHFVRGYDHGLPK
jgi:hypothetical protein